MKVEDIELLLQSWTQINALEFVESTAEYGEQKKRIEQQLKDQFDIDQIQLVGRTLEEYTVGYQQSAKPFLIRFDAEEIESIYEV